MGLPAISVGVTALMTLRWTTSSRSPMVGATSCRTFDLPTVARPQHVQATTGEAAGPSSHRGTRPAYGDFF
jgi:hypothetical protein